MVVLTRRSARSAEQLCPQSLLCQNTTATMKPKAQRKRPSPPSSPRYSSNPSSPSFGSSSMPSHTGGSGSGGGKVSRRPYRPVDRQKMRDWLLDILNSERMVENIWWIKRDKQFAVKWSHAARQNFTMKDRALFRAWALHTGIYKEGDEEDHKKWKSNFRCAIHSLQDVVEITEKDGRKGQHAARIYEILDTPIDKKRLKTNQSICKTEECALAEGFKRENSDSDSQGSTSYGNLGSTISPPACSQAEIPATASKTIGLPSLPTFTFPKAEPNNSSSNTHATTTTTTSNLPNFHQLGVSSTSDGFTAQLVQPSFLCGGSMTVKKEPGIPVQSGLALAPSSQLSYPIPSSCSFPIPVPASLPPIPMDLLEGLKLEEEDMVPVGYCTVSRQRTPSGDSGHPSSPEQLAMQIDVVEEVASTTDEGIELLGRAHLEMSELQNYSCQATPACDQSGPAGNCPERVLIEEIPVLTEDYSYTSLRNVCVDTTP